MQKNNDVHTALEILTKMRQSLVQSLVEELISHKDEEPTSFSLLDIEDRFAMRMANLNTLIGSLQDMPMQASSENNRITSKVHEIPRNKLQNKLDELLTFLSPDALLHLSIIPTANDKYLIIMANGE